jgi:hypothetical protein
LRIEIALLHNKRIFAQQNKRVIPLFCNQRGVVACNGFYALDSLLSTMNILGDIKSRKLLILSDA